MTSIQNAGRTDHQVKQDIIAELEWMPSVQSDRIGVAIDDGAVTMSGEVPTFAEKEAALRAAFRVRGVTAVVDDVEVHHTRTPRDDVDIARDATTVLEHSETVPLGSVAAAVRHGTVKLTGTVTWQYQREALGKAMAALPGVHGVSNLVTLEPEVDVSPEAARSNIAEALRRNADVEADRITVEVTGTKITLRGKVSSWRERGQANHAAWCTPGVTHVDNLLRVVR